MYEILELHKEPLTKENIFYEGDTSRIYKVDDLIYKIYYKKEPFKRHILDYLIEHYDDLKDISTPPMNKLKVDDNYGMKMRYVDSIDFLSYLEKNISPEEMVRILKILSNNLKKINALSIHFSDLHHHNILIRKDGYPLFTDLDDASVKDYGSTHICVMAHLLHNVGEKNFQYEDDLIRYGNLDQECLTLMLLNYMMNRAMERLSYDEFNKELDIISKYFNNDFMKVITSIKDKDDNTIITPYNYYIGDYIDDKVIEGISKVKRRYNNEKRYI